MESKFLVQRTRDDKHNANNVEARSFKVAKPDFSKASTRDEFSNTLQRRSKYSHLKFDENGRLKPSSVLGDVRDFMKYASDMEEQQEVCQTVGGILKGGAPRTSTSKSRPATTATFADQLEMGSPKTAPAQQLQPFNQANALENWQQKMAERKRIHGRISELIPRREGSTTLMNSADGTRKINETRMDIDKAIPAIDYGKGFRSGSEFWRLHENIGDDVSGLKMTLTKSERGMGESHIERISKPTDIIEETTSRPVDGKTGKNRFFENPYLRERMRELNPVMVREHRVEQPGLLVRGSSRPSQTAPVIKSKTPGLFRTGTEQGPLSQKYMTSTPAVENPFSGLRDVVPSIAPSEFVGPILKINHNQIARYNQHSDIEERVLLQTNANGQVTKSILALENIGSTRIKFHFRRIDNDGISPEPPRFFFNRLGGCVLPGETIEFPFRFKSQKPGIFTESWILATEPELLIGCINIRLYAIAYDTDEMKEKRENVRQMLQARESTAAAKSAFDRMLNQAFTQADEKAHFGDLSFAKNNAKTRFDYSNARWQGKVDFEYRHDDVARLQKIWARYSPEADEWNFDIAALKERVADAADLDDPPANADPEDDLMQINTIVNNLRKNTSVKQRRQDLLTVDKTREYRKAATGMFGQMIYRMVDAGYGLKAAMKLDEPTNRPKSDTKKRPNSNQSSRESQRSNKSESKVNVAAKAPAKEAPVRQAIPEESEPKIESAVDLVERKKQFTDRMHTVGDSLFTGFIESILESFEST